MFVRNQGKLAVDNTSDQLQVARAIQELRRTAAAGRLAQKALDSIQDKGYFEGQVIAIGGESVWNDDQGEYRKLVLQPYREPKPEYLCPLSGLQVKLATPEKGYSAGISKMMAPVVLYGEMKVQWERGRHETVYREVGIGHIRINKGHSSFVPPQAHDGQSAFQIYRDSKSSKYAGDTIAAIARAAGAVIIMAAIECLDIKPRNAVGDEDKARQRMPREDQLTADLHQASPAWLVAGGHAERFMTDMWNMLPVLDVMSA